jgi:hypothetical protein
MNDVLRHKDKENQLVVCGDCLYPISMCKGCAS